MIGKELGRYRIVGQLGKGGMGEVYLAEDGKLDRKVALKVLVGDVASDPERLTRFEREAKAVAALNHPNIVTLYTVEEEQGTHFLTMELVRGKRLSELIPRHGLPLDRFFELAIPLTEAISAAHDHGITHRDLKPGNVMVGDDGRLKVLDFGLAKLRDEARATEAATQLPTESVTKEGQIVGTVAYMSPEQAEGKPVDHRSDIFSLGVLFHEMATGQCPFQGDTRISVISSILRDEPVSVTELNRNLPRHLGRIVRHCLRKDPEQRCQTAKELRNELVELKDEVDSGEVLPAAAVRALPRRRRRGLVVTALAAVAVGAAALTYVWLEGRAGVSPGSTVPLHASFTRLTSHPGPELFPALSPDGKSFVFASEAAGNSDVYLQRVGGEKAINLTEDCAEDDTQPVFSPDGAFIAFRSGREGGGIFVMGATGESVRRLTESGGNPVWSPDGREILFATASIRDPGGRGGISELWAVRVSTGEKRRIFEGDAVQPHWSPGGRVAYWTTTGGQRDIWTIPAEGGKPTPVTDDLAVDWNPVWSPEGNLLYFSSDRGGSMNLWRVAVDERTGEVLGEPHALTTGSSTLRQHLSISSDGRQVAYVERLASDNIYRISFDPVEGRVEGESVAVTRGSRSLGSPHVSPDGEWITFSSAGMQEDIFVSRTDGSGRRQLTDDLHKDRRPRWSPDGRRITFYSNRTGSYEIWTIQPDGSRLERLTNTPGHSLVYPEWSPDGSRIATFCATHSEKYVFDSDRPPEAQTPRNLPPFELSENELNLFSWSPDGRWLAGSALTIDFTSSGLFLYSLEEEEYRKLTDIGDAPEWLQDSRRLLFSDENRLLLLDTESGGYQEILSPPEHLTLGEFVSLTPDDREIYFSLSTTDSDVWLMTLN